MRFLKSTLGRKIVMAITGLLILLFVIIHVIGNSTIYFGRLNAYAEQLHALPFLVWTYRVVMITAFSLHVFFGIQLTIENQSAKPGSYAVRNSLSATFAGKNMIWTGLIIGAFLFYHLLHFTFQITNPGISAGRHPDEIGRPDVFRMVVFSFQNPAVSIIYIAAMTALALHLLHGIQSSFQTLGLNSESAFPVIIKGGMIAAIILFIGYIAIPLSIYMGMLKG